MKQATRLLIVLATAFSALALAVNPTDFVGKWKGNCHGVGTGGGSFPYNIEIGYDSFTQSFNYIGSAYPMTSVAIVANALGTITSTAGWDSNQATLVFTKAEIWVSGGPNRLAQSGTVERAELTLADGKLTVKTRYQDTAPKPSLNELDCEYEK